MESKDNHDRILRELIDALESTSSADLFDFIRALEDIYKRFSDRSNRVLRALRRFMPDNRGKLYIGDHIIQLLEEYGPLPIKELIRLTIDTFEYTVTPRTIYSSVYNLIKSKRIVRYYDTGRRKKMLAVKHEASHESL